MSILRHGSAMDGSVTTEAADSGRPGTAGLGGTPKRGGRIASVAFHGIDVLGVDVQVQTTSGLPAFAIVGLPDKAVGESRERVRAALASLGLALPPKRIIVNL